MRTLLDEILHDTEFVLGAFDHQEPIETESETSGSRFTLHDVKCHKTEDWGTDECLLRIYVDGVRKKTLRKTMNAGQRWQLGYSFPFDKKVVVKLWDEDSPDPDDLIGTLIVGKKTKKGKRTKRVGSGGPDYGIRYNVRHPLACPSCGSGVPPCNDSGAVCVIREGDEYEGLDCWWRGKWWDNANRLDKLVEKGKARYVCDSR